MAVDASLLQAAATAGFNGLVSLIAAAGRQLRLAIAAHLEQASAVAIVEAQVWSRISAQLPHYVDGDDPNEWLLRQALEPVKQHLLAADQRAIGNKDTLSYQTVQYCLEALASGAEMTISSLSERLSRLDGTHSRLLEQRYLHKIGVIDLARTFPGGAGAAAKTLFAARAACDWTGIAQPSTPGEMLLPSLIEDWISEQIDEASKSLLAQKVSSDLHRAAQAMRQVRVHVVLSAYYTEFDAEALARKTRTATGNAVMFGSAPLAVTRSASDPLRPVSGGSHSASQTRSSSQRSTVIPKAIGHAGKREKSPFLWILSALLIGAVGIGAIALSAGSGTKSTKPAPQNLAQSVALPIKAATTQEVPEPIKTIATPAAPQQTTSANEAPVVHTSANQTNQQPPNALWTPAQITTVVWYDASDAGTLWANDGKTSATTSVYRWDDKSGNGKHQRQEKANIQPTTGSRTLNGKNVLNFQAGFMHSSLQNIPSGTFSVYTVMQYDSASWHTSAAWGMRGTTGYAVLGMSGGKGQFNCAFDGGVLFSGSPQNGPSIYAITYDNSETKARKAYVDGAEKASTSYPTPCTDFSEGLRLMSKSGNVQTVSGGLAEFIVAADAAVETRQKIEGYLAHKWGLSANLPADHPYKNKTPVRAVK